jgi:hypothetical protein
MNRKSRRTPPTRISKANGYYVYNSATDKVDHIATNGTTIKEEKSEEKNEIKEDNMDFQDLYKRLVELKKTASEKDFGKHFDESLFKSLLIGDPGTLNLNAGDGIAAVMFNPSEIKIKSEGKTDYEKLLNNELSPKEIVLKIQNDEIRSFEISEYLSICYSLWDGRKYESLKKTYKYFTLVLREYYKSIGKEWSLERVYGDYSKEIWDFFQSLFYVKIDFSNQENYKAYNRIKTSFDYDIEGIKKFKQRNEGNNIEENDLPSEDNEKLEYIKDKYGPKKRQPGVGLHFVSSSVWDTKLDTPTVPDIAEPEEDEEFEEEIDGDDVD